MALVGYRRPLTQTYSERSPTNLDNCNFETDETPVGLVPKVLEGLERFALAAGLFLLDVSCDCQSPDGWPFQRLNMVERFFRNVTVNRLRRGIFRDVIELLTTIKDYVDHQNEHPIPFIWTASATAGADSRKRE